MAIEAVKQKRVRPGAQPRGVARALLLASAGACGVPGCGDPGCSFGFGECHCGCGEATPVAGQTRFDRGCVAGYPYRFRSRHREAAARRRRRERVAALYLSGLTIAQVSTVVGVALPTVGSDLRAHGIAARAAGAPRKYPAQGARVCELATCETTFVPQRAFDVVRGYGRFCSHACYTRSRRRHPDPAVRDCPACGVAFVPLFPAWGDQRFCSRSCRATFLCEPLLQGLAPAARQKALGKVKGRIAARTRGSGRPRTQLDDEFIAAVERLRDRGWGRVAIARQLDTTEHRVRLVLAEKGFSPASSLN